ncbi:hypothetical protein RCL_jg22072.t1 [Rhizophagus clarus]|uniref:Uncharacterized protein n=1 Tax=Rhizophagus clarus TaxID=94130 RepID=A0A8H3LK35_9GLOM|nr:hypothetical protein RCL_jg22072.t1 [Rhizophagus clarus]
MKRKMADRFAIKEKKRKYAEGDVHTSSHSRNIFFLIAINGNWMHLQSQHQVSIKIIIHTKSESASFSGIKNAVGGLLRKAGILDFSISSFEQIEDSSEEEEEEREGGGEAK